MAVGEQAQESALDESVLSNDHALDLEEGIFEERGVIGLLGSGFVTGGNSGNNGGKIGHGAGGWLGVRIHHGFSLRGRSVGCVYPASINFTHRCLGSARPAFERNKIHPLAVHSLSLCGPMEG